jgi:hypothetical protein
MDKTQKTNLTQFNSPLSEIFKLQVLICLCKAVYHKQLQKWESDEWQMYHENLPSHSAQLVQQSSAKYNISIPQMKQLLCYQIWLPMTSLCSLNLKKTSKDLQFDDLEIVE